MEYEQDLEGEAGEHFDPAEDVPEEDLVAGGKPRREAADHKRRPRFVQFLVAVWAELQRVQWPDRQAMVTLTGVVLGFVLIAGGYLGLLDAVASRVMQAIL
ncbi:MAG: preprotein translocase subunit SecE [Solirubrobacterales bacterium]|nr:preprotein translocase subunit SecE [Solirubrobacterales bacterium]